MGTLNIQHIPNSVLVNVQDPSLKWAFGLTILYTRYLILSPLTSKTPYLRCAFGLTHITYLILSPLMPKTPKLRCAFGLTIYHLPDSVPINLQDTLTEVCFWSNNIPPVLEINGAHGARSAHFRGRAPKGGRRFSD